MLRRLVHSWGLDQPARLRWIAVGCDPRGFARHEIADVYALGQRVFQPFEPELLHDRAVTSCALVLGLVAIPVEVVFTLVLFLV